MGTQKDIVAGVQSGGCARARVFAAAAMLSCASAYADPHIVVNSGLPVQIKPTFQEPGLPAFNFPAGGTTGTSSGDSGAGPSGASGSTVAGIGGADAGGAALDLMNAQSWGSQAAAAATALGVNPAALAATCMMESQCQNVGSSSSVSSAAGAFQMISTTYTADINGAVAEDPAIASNIVQGLAGQMDPGTEAYAASYELQQDAQMLQNGGVSNPTVLSVRAVYQFGGATGVGVALAQRFCQPREYYQSLVIRSRGQWPYSIVNRRGLACHANESPRPRRQSSCISRILKEQSHETLPHAFRSLGCGYTVPRRHRSAYKGLPMRRAQCRSPSSNT